MPIVLVEPQIPQNTGSIARSCAATDTPLHIVGPIPFEISEKRVKRAGLDYWPYVNLTYHDSWEQFQSQQSPKNLWYISTKGKTDYFDARLGSDDFLVFGSETKGLGEEFLGRVDSSRILKIPMSNEHVRSLNLSNAVSIVLYEQIRQRVIKAS